MGVANSVSRLVSVCLLVGLIVCCGCLVGGNLFYLGILAAVCQAFTFGTACKKKVKRYHEDQYRIFCLVRHSLSGIV